jgi:hypothetical protein
VPVVGRLPLVVRHGLVLLGFTLAVVALVLVVSVTLNQLVAVKRETRLGRVTEWIRQTSASSSQKLLV